MRKLALVLALTAIPALAAAQARKGASAKKAAPALAPKVQVAGVRVVGPGFGPENDHQRPFNWSPGVTVVAAIRVSPPYALVGIDKDKSSLEMVDSQGNVLEQPEVDWNPDFTKDGTTALVELEAKGLPAEGSAHIGAKGTLVFNVASGTKPIKVSSLRFVKDTPVKLGAASIAVGDVEEDAANGESRVTFKGATPVMKGIKTVRAKDAKGTPIEVSWYSSGGWTEQYEMGYRFKTTAKGPFNLEFEMYDGLREVPVTFDLKAGVGVPIQ